MFFIVLFVFSIIVRVIINQYNNLVGFYFFENIFNFNNVLELKIVVSGVEVNSRFLDYVQFLSSFVIDKEFEVYKMFQEKQELNEFLKQFMFFLVLQEILEFEEKGDFNKFLGFRSVKVFVIKVVVLIGNVQKLFMCDKCGIGIVGVFVKLWDCYCYFECYVCIDCGINLKQKGYFFVED